MYSKWPKLMLMSGITSAWLLYELAMAAPKPRAGRWRSSNMAYALIGLIGSLVMRASEK